MQKKIKVSLLQLELLSKDVENNLYVDNLITGTDSTKEAIDYYIEAKKIFREASIGHPMMKNS